MGADEFNTADRRCPSHVTHRQNTVPVTMRTPAAAYNWQPSV